MTKSKRVISAILPACILGMGLAVAAQSVVAEESFYEGKTLSVVIRSTPGGGYDEYGRLIAQHIGKHIPGNPNVIAVNRPGAGGMVSANYMFNQAPQDGTEILIPAREFVFAERVDTEGVRYNSLEFNYLGSATAGTSAYLAAPGVPVESLSDLEAFDGTFLFGVSGRSGGSYVLTLLLQAGGYDVDVITGFEGTGDQALSALRGDTHGISSTYSGVRNLVEDEGFTPFAKLGDSPELEHIDDIRDFLEGDALALAEVMLTPMSINRPFITGPDVPQERVEILQQAFKETLEDPDFLADAERAGRPISYIGPEEMRNLYEATLNAPDSVIETYQEE